jgi:RsiW-degrading membrane proteinase PrsW (M82 family)
VALPRKIMKWLKLYLLVLAITIAIILLGTAIYARWTNKPFFSALRSTFMVSALVLISIGAVSLIPLSEYSYIRGGGRNPVIIREGM